MNKDNKEYDERTLFNGLNGNCLISPIELVTNLVGPKIRLRILASGNGSNFEYIIKSIQNKELNAEVMPVQIDYENEIFNILESFNIEGDTESVVKNLRLKFDGIKGKKSRFKA